MTQTRVPATALALVIVVMLIAAVGPARADEKTAEPVEIEFLRDVVYGKGADVEIKLNLARPKSGAQPAPARRACIILIHGGGWRAGSKEQHDEMAKAIARQGDVGVTVGYRLMPQARFPAQVHDVKCAVRFLRAHADQYGLDPDRIGVVGFSAGAHLAMMLAVTGPDDKLEGEGGWADESSRIAAAVSFFGPTDMARDDLPPLVRPLVKDFTGDAPSPASQACKRASPINYLDDTDAPLLLFQGTNDPIVPHAQASLMADAMARAGVGGRVEMILGAGHGWGGEEARRTSEATRQFLAQRLAARRSPPQ